MNFNHFFEVNVKIMKKPKQSQKIFSFSTADYTPDGKQIILQVMLMILKMQIAQKVSIYCGY
jgi:hypothetical protein